MQSARRKLCVLNADTLIRFPKMESEPSRRTDTSSGRVYARRRRQNINHSNFPHRHATETGFKPFIVHNYRYIEKENDKSLSLRADGKEALKQRSPQGGEIPDGSTCKAHQQPYLFFCNETRCRLFLCNTCTEQHSGHVVTDLIEEADRCKTNLLEMVNNSEKMARMLEHEKEKVYLVEEELKVHARESLFQLDQRKDRLVDLIVSVIDTMKHETIQQKSSELLKIHDVVKTLDGGASKFRDVAKESANSSEDSSFMDLIKNHNTIHGQYKDLMQVVSTIFSEPMRFNHLDFRAVDSHSEDRYCHRLVGVLEPRHIPLDFLKSSAVVSKLLDMLEDSKCNTDLSSAREEVPIVTATSSLMRSDSVTGAGYEIHPEVDSPSSPSRRRESHDHHQSRDECLNTFNTYLEPLQAFQCLSEDGTIIVSGCSAGIWWLKQFKDDGGFLWHKQVSSQPTGLASFKIPHEPLDGTLKAYLAVAYKQENKIDFHSMDLKEEVAFTYDIPGQDPGCLVFSKPLKKLLYVDEGTYPSALREVEIPEAALFRRSMHLIITKSRNISGLCLMNKAHNEREREANDGEGDLLVILSDGEKLCAYSYQDGCPVWQLAGDISSSSGAGVVYNINPLGICVVRHSTKSLIYVADCNNKSILKVDKKGKVVKMWLTRGTSLGGPRQLTYDTIRSQLFVLHVRADGRLHVNVY